MRRNRRFSFIVTGGAATCGLVVSILVSAKGVYDDGERLLLRSPSDVSASPPSEAATVAELPTLVFVNSAATGLNNGSSWTNAYQSLSVALRHCEFLCELEVWVAKGTYRPSNTGDRTGSFDIFNAKVYGGFAGNETQRNQRDPSLNTTVLSGDLALNDPSGFVLREDNSYHVVSMPGNLPAVLDGFTVYGGNADSAISFRDRGAGIYVTNGNPVVRNCVIASNSALSLGGGAFNGGGSVHFVDCAFVGNRTVALGGKGGGVYNATDANTTKRFANVKFLANTSERGGGAYDEDTSGAYVNCLFSGNSASIAGALYSAPNRFSPAGTSVDNCTFSANTGTGGVDGMYNTRANRIRHSIFWNTGSTQDDQLAGTTLPSVEYSIVRGWTGLLGGEGNSGTDPRFVDANGADNVFGSLDDDLRVRFGSPAIDSGNTSLLPTDGSDVDSDGNTSELVPLDLARMPRFVNHPAIPNVTGTGVVVDKGAFEFQLSGCTTSSAECLFALMEPGAASCPPAAPRGKTCRGGGDCGSSLNRFSGEFVGMQNDIELPGRGMDVTWQRSFRSRMGTDSTGGSGWSTSYDIRLVDENDFFSVYGGDGRRDLYISQPDGTWRASQLFRELRSNPDGTYTLTFEDTGTWTFFGLAQVPAGRIKFITDRDDNTMTFEYSQDRLTVIRDSLNRAVTISYTPEGQISSLTDWAARQTRYEYYQQEVAGGNPGDLKSVTTPAVIGTPTGNDFPNGKTTTYTYTTGFADERLNHDLLTITDPKGQTYLQNIYAHTIAPSDPRHTLDPSDIHFDRVVRQTLGNAGETTDYFYVRLSPTPGGAVSAGVENNVAVLKVIERDRVGNVSEYYYDLRNLLVMQRDFTGRADPTKVTTDTKNCTEETNCPMNKVRASDPNFFETRYEYNDEALLTHVVYPEGNEEQFVYDESNADIRSRGNLLQHCRIPGPRGGDQTQICESFVYDTGMGGCCGTNFVTRHVDGRGHETLHVYDADGNRIHTQHRITSIVEDWEYNSFGQMTAHILPDNGSDYQRQDQFTYYTSGPQTGYLRRRIVDVGGLNLTTTYEYDAVGNVVRVTDPRGHDAQYVVNQLNQVVREISREVTDGSGVRYQRDRYYDFNNNLVRTDVQNVDDQGIVQANSHLTTIYEYEILNNLVRMCQEDGSYTNPIPGLPHAPDCDALPSAEFIFMEYGYDGNRNRTLERKGAAVSGAQPANTVNTLYDERDLVFREIRAQSDPDQSSIQFDYDGNGNRVKTHEGIENNPRIREVAYDGYDRLVVSVDPPGNAVQSHYDANGNLLSTRTDREFPVLPGNNDKRLAETFYEYDAMDRRTRQDMAFFDAESQTSIGDGLATMQTFYNDNSQVILTVDDNQHESLTSYDTANRRSRVTDAKGNTTTFAYDANSNTLSMSSVEKSDLGNPDQTFTTSSAYDNLNRRIRMVDNVGNTTQYAHDSRNNSVLETDALGRQVRRVYDGLDRLVATARDMNGNGAGPSDPADIVTTQAWDKSSRRIRQTDDNGNSTRYTFDALDRQVATVYADGTSHATVFDVHGNIVRTIDANDSVATTAYDLLNRPSFRSITPGKGVSVDTTAEAFQYDGLSRLIRAEDDDSIVLRAYDSLANVLEETLTIDKAGHPTTGTIASTYDGLGNKLICTYPGGRRIVTQYDELNRKSVIADFTDAPQLVATYKYVGPARVERREYGNGTRTDYVYDGATGIPNPPGDFGVRRIISTTHTRVADGSVIDDRSFTWDKVGNKTQRRDPRLGGTELTHGYSYDASYRLIRTTVTRPDLSRERDTQYSFDGVQNRTVVTGNPDDGEHVGNYTIEPGDFEVNQYTLTPFHRQEYDNNGNLAALIDDDVTGHGGDWDLADFARFQNCFSGAQPFNAGACDRFNLLADNLIDLQDWHALLDSVTGPRSRPAEITYDYRNRMTEYRDTANGQRHIYAYDALGRRIRKVIGADGMDLQPVETRYLYDGDRIIEEQGAFEETEATYVFGLYIDEVLNMRRDVDGSSTPEDYFYHSDDLHSVMAITGADGSIVERFEYDDFGAVTIVDSAGDPLDESSADAPWFFTGRQLDPETGLYYYRARFLNPASGRFVTRDPIGMWSDAVNFGNGLAYAANDPTTWTDPLGLVASFDTCVGGNCAGALFYMIHPDLAFWHPDVDPWAPPPPPLPPGGGGGGGGDGGGGRDRWEKCMENAMRKYEDCLETAPQCSGSVSAGDLVCGFGSGTTSVCGTTLAEDRVNCGGIPVSRLAGGSDEGNRCLPKGGLMPSLKPFTLRRSLGFLSSDTGERNDDGKSCTSCRLEYDLCRHACETESSNIFERFACLASCEAIDCTGCDDDHP